MSPRFLKNKDTKGYVFSIYSYDCRERPHVHVKKGDRVGKFWIASDNPDAPEFELFDPGDFSNKQLRQIARIIESNLDQLRQEWDEFCSRYIS
ncbi:MAG: DUF4160 domain-containing protein [Burkholderiales bacterium]|nr:DUF4160 domain-containing protein [Anaerolineae bacterium]